MSFATGALQAVDKNIDRYRAEKAAEEERTDAAAQRMKELEFQRETTFEAQKRTAASAYDIQELKQKGTLQKNYHVIGGLQVPKGKGADGITSQITYLAQNPEAFNVAFNDANTRPQLEYLISNAVLRARTEKGLFSSVSAVGKEAPQAPVLSLLFLPALRNNPQLLDYIRKLEDGGVGDPPAPAGSASQVKIGGENISIPDGEWIQPVVDVLNSTTLGGIGRNQSEQVATASKLMGGRNYDPNQGPYQGNNKFWSAASSPFVKFISTKGRGSSDETKAAIDWINDPKHGFVDDEGKKTNDYYLLVDTYANKSDGSTQPGYKPQANTYTMISGKDTTIRKSQEEIVKSLPLAQGAKRNLMRLEQKVDKIGTGSRLTTSLLAGITGAEAVVRDAISIVGNALTDDKFTEGARGLFKNATNKLQKAKKGGNSEAIAAAEINMLETALAYQLTSILQGGTGGRTISDTDVTRALNLFGGTLLSRDQKLNKIKFIMGMVDQTIERGTLFATVRPNSNAEYYRTLQKLDRAGVLSQYNIDNFDTVLNSQFEAAGLNKTSSQEGIGPITKAVQDISKAAEKNPDFTREAYAKELENFLGGAEPLVSAGRYVLNTNDAKKWGNAVAKFSQDGDERALSGIAKGLMSEGRNKVFDAERGQVIPVQWIIRGGKAEFEPMKEGAPVTRKVTRESSAPLPSKTSPAKKLFTPNNSQKIQDIENRIADNKKRFVRYPSTERELTELESQLKQLQEQ